MQNEERIAVLELQYRNMKRIVLGVAWVISLNFAICSLIIVGYFVSTTNAPDVIQAKKFEVVNDAGIKVAELTSTTGGVGALSIGDNDGVKLALLTVYPDGAALGLLNKAGGEVPLAMFAATRYGGTMYITNKDGQVVGALSVIQNGDGVLKTSNAKGRETFKSP